MPGRVEHGDRPALLDDLALRHDAHAVRHLAHDREIVGDEEQRHVQAFPQRAEERENLCLDRHVERRRRLVGDQEIRLVGQRHRDHDPLALPPGELVRVRPQPLLGLLQPHEVQQLQRPRTGFPAAHRPVHEQDLSDLLLDRVQRVQRGHRLLEHHPDAFAADRQQVLVGQADHFRAGDPDRAPRVARVLVRQELHHRQRRHALPRARLADQRHRLAPVDVEADAPDRLVTAEGDGQVVDLENPVAHVADLRGSKASRTPSPTNTSSVSMTARVKKPESPSQGAWMLALPWASSSPSDG